MDASFQDIHLSLKHSLDEVNFLEDSGQGGGAAGDEYCTNTVLRLNSFGSIPHKYSSVGIKRKSILVDEFSTNRSHSLLSLGLGRSSSSSECKGSSATVCTSFSTSKEADKESPMSLALGFPVQFGSDKTKESTISIDDYPAIDLKLSLSVGQSKSDAISVQPSSSQSPLENSPDDQSLTIFDRAQGLTSPAPTHPELSFSVHTATKSSTSSTSNLLRYERPHQNSNLKKCQIEGCEKGARGASRRCISHGGGPRCQKPGCQKGAEGRTIYCKAHGGGRRCEYLGCMKSAEGCTDFCIAHGGGWRCSQEGCTRAARGKSGFCIRHGGGKRCQEENCAKSAEGLSGFCISHGGGRRCQFLGCTKCAQGSTNFCKAHGGWKRCTFSRCTKGAEGSTPFCKGHGGGKPCAFDIGVGCNKSVHGATNFCVAHGGGEKCCASNCTKSTRGRIDFCVCHGGGKRCQYEGCGAQGSTDYCKGHGVEKRCCWDQLGSLHEFQTSGPCNSSPMVKARLCVLQSGFLHENRVLGGVTTHNSKLHYSKNMKNIVSTGDEDIDKLKLGISSANQNSGSCSNIKQFEMLNTSLSLAESGTSSVPIIPEGRVHGGSLMAVLAARSNIHSSNINGNVHDTSEPCKYGMIPEHWI